MRNVWIGLIALTGAAGNAAAQATLPTLQEDQVLVVYDSRIGDSRLVAEYYAGSVKVPGGVGGITGSRPTVRVFDLAAGGAAAIPSGTVSYALYTSRLRDPVRAHLTANNLAYTVRCIVLTKGLAHRIDDTDAAGAGDNPTTQGNEFNAGDATAVAVDAEMTLLWQNLNAGEAGGTGDSKSDGFILNPFWRSTFPINGYPTGNMLAAKNLVARGGAGIYWGNATTLNINNAERTTAGDMYLVCRLDGTSVADVQGIIDRARAISLNTATTALILDESGSNGVADANPNAEFDNQGDANTRAGDDYEQTRDLALSDGRFATANINYNAASGAAAFIVGPRVAFNPPYILVSTPIALLTHYGGNHNGRPTTVGGEDARTWYEESFNCADGAIFNTMESYNGRAFGGLTGHPSIPQGQAADFLRTGGTFAACNVWEPFAHTVPDSRYFVTQFLLGGMTWGEAAYAALPAISWQQMVVGDPLGKVLRPNEDLTGDSRVSADDLYAWEANPTDLNNSGVADDADRQILTRTIRLFEAPDMINRRR